jgi:hypothetical protein
MNLAKTYFQVLTRLSRDNLIDVTHEGVMPCTLV